VVYIENSLMCRSIINAIEESDDDVCRRRDGIMAMKLKKGRSMDPHTYPTNYVYH
jgi:hypothetical protein